MDATTDAHHRPEGWWAFPPLYAVGVYLAAHLPLPAWVFAALGVAAALLGRGLARHLYRWSSSGDWCLTLAGLAAGAWCGAARVFGPTVLWPWLVGAAAVLGGWWALIVWCGPPDPAAAAAAGDDRGPVGDRAPDAMFYQRVLDQSGSADCEVLDVAVSPSGGVESVTIAPAGEKPVTRAEFTGRLPRITVQLARSMRRTRGIKLLDDDVHVEPGESSAEWVMHVSVARVLTREVEYRPAPGPQPWCGPKLIGAYEDDQPMEFTLCHEGRGSADLQVVGMKGAGKSNLLNVIIRRMLESDQGEVWLVGSNKLIKLAEPWVTAYLTGRAPRPVIDWVAGEDPRVCLVALAAAYHWAVLSNRATFGNDARRPERGKGALLLIIDESSDLLRRDDLRIQIHDGQWLTASELVAKIQQIGRTSPVSVIKANQDALYDSDGSDGNRQRRNAGAGAALQVMRAQDATSVVPGLPGHIDATKLRDNAMWFQPATDEPRVMRGKAARLTDAAIDAAAVELADRRHGLDPAITAQLATSYTIAVGRTSVRRERLELGYATRWTAAANEGLAEKLAAQGLEWPAAAAHHETAAGEPAEPTPEEPTMPDPTPDPTPRQPEGEGRPPLPDGWDDPGFDVWAALGIDEPVGEPAPAGTPDPSVLTDPVRRMAEWARRHGAGAAPAQLPDPLGLVLALLDRPGAPAEWVPTVALAVAMGRVAANADAVERRRATEQLGKELTLQCPGLTSTDLPRSVDAARRRGFRVADLRAAGQRLREAG